LSQKIKILPENLANKIAAGEVVNRPESVVKELMENSLDSGASQVEVFIKNAGKNLIHVIDDGSGMNDEDAVLSIQRHATSKISSMEDLEYITTFGFRGEALASIAAVSIFELRTRREEDEVGNIVKIDENSSVILEKGAAQKGTSIAVKNLFYNVPARRNFLKSNQTELKHIIETFKKIALSNPEISFKLYNDDEIILDYKKGDIKKRLVDVFGENILQSVLEVKELTDYMSLTGFVSKPVYLRRNKGEQYFFLNNRAVSSRIINHAAFTAYENILDKGDYPFFVLFLVVDPKKIDVNVHPAKLEVKFEDEKEVYAFVKAVVKKTIASHDIVPTFSINQSSDEKSSLSYSKGNKLLRDDFSDRPLNSTLRKPTTFSDDEVELLFSRINRDIKNESASSEVRSPFEETTTQVEHSNNISSSGQPETPFIILLHNKYILSQIRSGLMIIDAHVAHERILYEQAINAFNANIPFAQQLLFPQPVKLDPADYLLVKELEPYLTNLGFEIKFQPKNTILITGIPSDVKIEHEVETLLDILHEYRKNEVEKELEVRDNLAKSYSCKAAIKAGDSLTEKEMRILVDKLFATSMPYVCPHGRPIVIKIPLEEFDKRFGRT
jgi:DNA mismatch repair protein MutL